ncbi:MAG: 3'-5' exonuclease [Opitutales bacterium]|nr:3'-5' exonuclease [Opitutales bacterium]
MHWKNIAIHVLDFEGSVNTGIVEYGFATVLGGSIISTHTRLCGVRHFIPAEETAIHGLDNASVSGRPTVEADWELFSGLRNSGLFGSHNASAEKGMLATVWMSPGRVPNFSQPEMPVGVEWGPWIDTCRIAKNWFPRERSHKLGDLIRRFEIQDRVDASAAKFCPRERSHYHCALYDAIAAAELLINICEHPSFADSSILDLVCASAGKAAGADFRQGEFPFDF